MVIAAPLLTQPSTKDNKKWQPMRRISSKSVKCDMQQSSEKHTEKQCQHNGNEYGNEHNK